MTPIPDRPAAPSPEVVEVAAKLTSLMKALVLSLSADWSLRTGQGHGHTHKLYALGIAEFDKAVGAYPDRYPPSRRNGVRHRLTPLGLAVRAHLLANQGDGRL